MDLVNDEIINKLPKIYETDSTPLMDKKIICKFFNPDGLGSWYVIEGQQEEDDFIFFGLVDLHEKEFGYFSLKELQKTIGPNGLKIERDIYFIQSNVKDILP